MRAESLFWNFYRRHILMAKLVAEVVVLLMCDTRSNASLLMLLQLVKYLLAYPCSVPAPLIVLIEEKF